MVEYHYKRMPRKEYTSHGQIATQAPIFGPDGQEIMSVQDPGGEFVTIFTEDADEPGKLNPTLLHRSDYKDLLQSQTQKPKGKGK